MNRIRIQLYLSLSLGFLIPSSISYAQEEKLDDEESAEVFLDEYTDEFQENFFEALKQKGIQNYDRAINLFLECKRLDATSIVVDHELAKTYFLDKKYISAQQYAIEALVAEPKNYWYLDTLMSILEKQSNTIDAVKSTIPYTNRKLQENLALVYYKKKQYQKALKIINGVLASNFKDELTAKINDEINRRAKRATANSTSFTVVSENTEPSIKGLEMNLKSQLEMEQYRMVEMTAKDAVEAYPLQPFFYYAYGLALHKNNKNSQAIEVLETSLDYLFDDISLANKVYKALADAYTKTNNLSKANLYLSKIKPGF